MTDTTGPRDSLFSPWKAPATSNAKYKTTHADSDSVFCIPSALPTGQQQPHRGAAAPPSESPRTLEEPSSVLSAQVDELQDLLLEHEVARREALQRTEEQQLTVDHLMEQLRHTTLRYPRW